MIPLAALWLSPSAAGEEPEEAVVRRLERRLERRVERTHAAEDRWREAMEASEEGAAAEQRRAERAERELVTARAREGWIQRQLAAWDAPEAELRILYATNRRRGADRGEVAYRPRDADRLEFGVVTVHIPRRHAIGLLDRGLHVVSIQPLTTEAFSFELFRALDQAGPAGEVLAWVHGYNNSFAYASGRLAQVAHDLDRPLVPVLFSWPSHGDTSLSLFKYTFDENAAARSSAALADALDELLASTQGAPLSVVAHSMGSRVLADAVLDLQYQERQERRFDQVVFAAPDVDASVFERRYLTPLTEAAGRVSVYCASDDRALQVSRTFHGGYDRLGSCRDRTTRWLHQAGVEVIDASRLLADQLGHDKLADSPRLLADLAMVLDGVPAADERRGLSLEDSMFVLPP